MGHFPDFHSKSLALSQERLFGAERKPDIFQKTIPTADVQQSEIVHIGTCILDRGGLPIRNEKSSASFTRRLSAHVAKLKRRASLCKIRALGFT